MTLGRLNPTGGRSVINRNDDSAARPVRVVAVGERGLLLDAVIEATNESGTAIWWADWEAPAALIDHLTTQSVDLVLINLGAAGYTQQARDFIRLLAGRDLLAVVLDGRVRPPDGRTCVEAGALWAVNPELASLGELASTVRSAAAQRAEFHRKQRRATLAREAWTGAVRSSITPESSILTMRREIATRENAPNRTRRPSGNEVVAPGGLTGGEQGRQV